MARDHLSPAGKLRTWLIYGTMRGLVDFHRDFGLDCRGCKHALQGEESMWCQFFGEEINDYRIAEDCENHDARA